MPPDGRGGDVHFSAAAPLGFFMLIVALEHVLWQRELARM